MEPPRLLRSLQRTERLSKPKTLSASIITSQIADPEGETQRHIET
jgi:hypothetical protein